MFVYTFENINNIKDLKHSDSMHPKHKKKIEKIKDGIFAKFDYSDFKEKLPPKNESLQTYNELKMLKTLPEDGASNPAMVLRRVVLPQPEGPNKEKNSPLKISAEKFSRATMFPKYLLTF